MVRLSFALRPTPRVLAEVAALPRPSLPKVVWREAPRWLVTLRQLGHVPAAIWQPQLDAVRDELVGAASLPVVFGPSLRRYQQLDLPTLRCDELVATVLEASGPLVPVTHSQLLYPDLVLASGRIPAELTGWRPSTGWTAHEVLLVADRSSPRGTRLERRRTDDVRRITFDR
jgi:hypothetical protein